MIHIQNPDTVSIAAAIDLIEASLSHGLITPHDLENIGIQLDMLQDQTSRIPETRFIALWNLIDRNNKQSSIALTIGQTINPKAKGLLASWISQTSTLREALSTFINNISLMNPSETWSMVEDGRLCTLSFELRQDKGYPDIAIERSMSALVAWGRALSNHDFPITEAHFSFSPPSYKQCFPAIFNNAIRYNADNNHLTFHSKFLDMPITSGNDLLKGIMENEAEKALDELHTEKSVTKKIEDIIYELMSQGKSITVDKISDALSISRQTLYRELKKQDTDFKTVYDSVREKEAIYLLTSEKDSIEGISLKLGFKDSSSFYKAFKRWKGMSPSDYKLANVD